MPSNRGRPWKEVRAELLANSAELREEVERLSPRHRVIAEVVKTRASRKLTQTALAERLGVPQHHISRMESGAHTPTIETLDHVARAMGCRMEVKFVRERGGSRTAAVG
ncbi:MAG: Transcriptional regulator, contains XRE-family HTH domain [Chloroflexi bacterium]|nr:MAG: Transcriptional regulator, contains XRE-family HTH domain [Chloroflexota bacterium]